MSKFLKGVELFENETEEQGYFIPCLTGEGAPGLTQEGAVGSLYLDEDSGNIYKCIAIDNNGCQWVKETKNTAADVGAAPSGYGLGTHSSYFDFNNVDSITKNGWYCFATSGITLAGHFFGQGIMEVCCYDENAVRQVIHPAGNLSMEIVRQRSGGIWGEWVNCSPSAFAPAGYGLGTFSQMVDNPDNITNAGFYQCLLDITGTALNYYLIHQTHAHTYMHQIAIRVVDGFELHRTKADGTWGPWEWVNPPMQLGVEYRTTERIAGKAVYTKAIECGALGANSIDDVSHNTANIEAVWVSGGYWFDGTLYYSLPYFGTSDNQVLVSAYGGIIHRQQIGSAYNIQGMVVVLKYTKTTG